MGYPHAKSAAIPNDRLTPASFAGTTAEKDARLIVQAGASHSIRRATMAMATLWPTLVMTACQPGDAAAGSPTPSKTPTTTASSSTALRTCAAHPKVAGAAYGSPVRLSPGARAWLKLTFVQVQGEGDGYCKSGSDPVIYSMMVTALRAVGTTKSPCPKASSRSATAR